MNNLIAMPLVLPILVAVVLILIRRKVVLQRVLVSITLVGLIVVSAMLVHGVHTSGIQRLDFGGWKPPYGILFVADGFSTLLVLTASVITLCCVLFAFRSLTRKFEEMFVYPLILLMLAGVNGSFLTGDLFNLFVCFEVMLLASYALIALGGKSVQLRESLKYVITNIIASWLFLVAIAFLYGTIGTLNMAHIAQRVMELGQTPLITTIALLFFIVFALKAGLLLFFWLPGSYSVPVTPIAALFAALLTKVGIYAIVRTFTLLFTTGGEIVHQVVMIFAVLTVITGCFGALAYKDLRQIAAYQVVIGVGVVMMAVVANNEVAYEGAVFYLMHDMIGKAMLFLIVGVMIYVTKKTSYSDMSGLIRHYPLFGWLFFIVMLMLTGIPPLSGFIGKMLLGQGLIASGSYVLVAISFASSIVILLSLLRVMLQAIFGESNIAEEDKVKLSPWLVAPIALLAVLSLVLGVFAESFVPYVQNAAHVLANPQLYIDAILNK